MSTSTFEVSPTSPASLDTDTLTHTSEGVCARAETFEARKAEWWAHHSEETEGSPAGDEFPDAVASEQLRRLQRRNDPGTLAAAVTKNQIALDRAARAVTPIEAANASVTTAVEISGRG